MRAVATAIAEGLLGHAIVRQSEAQFVSGPGQTVDTAEHAVAPVLEQRTKGCSRASARRWRWSTCCATRRAIRSRAHHR